VASVHIEPRRESLGRARLLAPVVAIAASLALCSVLLAFTKASVGPAYWRMLVGAFGSPQAIADTLTRTTPLIFTGLAVAVAFRARLWNIGAEGQLYTGAVAAVVVSQSVVGWPSWIALPVVFCAGAVAGGLMFLLAVQLKYRLNVDEVVTTLLLNFIILLVVSFLIDGPLKDPLSMGWPKSVPVDDSLRLHPLVENSQLTWALPLGLLTALAVWVFNARTVWGFEGKVMGANPAAARFAGMPIGMVMARVALLSGGLAGLAGVSEVLGPRGFIVTDMSPGFGYTGIVVATLAQLHPLAVVALAALVAAIYVGSDSMSHAMGISNYISEVIVSVSLLAMLVAFFFSQYRIRRG
jgi:ABC-type uncharacterized transport system permease subunit